MGRIAQIILSILAILAIALNIPAFIEGNKTYFLVSRLLLMPAVAILTLVVLARARSKELARRFPGERKASSKPRDKKREE